LFSALLGHLVIALWPRRPLAVTRIWCLYELWCAVELKVPITAGFTDENRRNLIFDLCRSICSRNRVITIDVENAQATNIEDIQLILSKIRGYPGATELNIQVSRDFTQSLRKYSRRAIGRLCLYMIMLSVLAVIIYYVVLDITGALAPGSRYNSKYLWLRVSSWIDDVVKFLILFFVAVNMTVPRSYVVNVSSCQFYCLVAILLTCIGFSWSFL
jgi:hypothetical protein